jgi:sugar/nucleoside kinase (ribokinase family)
MRTGILAGGNWIRDHVKTIDAWPAKDGLANILTQAEGNGGGPYNVLKDLAKLGARFPLAGVGLIGDDADGKAILADCLASGIDSTRLRTMPGLRTSHTDVMTERGTGRRTFFHDRGANARLSPSDFDFRHSNGRFFYLGYLMLLDVLDGPGSGGKPQALEVLRSAREAGFRTAVDCVSANSSQFRATVAPVLPEVEVLFTNDFEAEQISGMALGRGGALNRGAVEAAARAFIGFGVREWAIVHFPEGACACSRDGRILWQPSVRMPDDLVLGSAGAGDALAAGILLGLHDEWSMERCLELGVCAAACSLLDPTCSASVRSHEKCLEYGRQRGFSEFNGAH